MKICEREVRKIAKKSTHRWAHHVAILTEGGRTVAVGYNRGECHAEDMAIRKLRLSGGHANRLYSYRIRRDGRIGASRPCDNCMALLREFGIQYVYYSDYNGSPLRLRIGI